MPIAAQPYSRDSLRSRWESERFASLVLAWVDWKRRKVLEALDNLTWERSGDNGERGHGVEGLNGLVRNVACELKRI